MSGLSVDFEGQLRGPWETAQGFLIEQLSLLQAQLAPIFPLVTALQAQAGALAGNPIVGLSGYPSLSLLVTDASSTPSFSPSLPGPLGFATAATLTPSALTVNTNNYTPSGIAAAAVMRIASTGAINLTGLIASSRSRMLLLVNIGAFTITLTNTDGSSSLANQFRCPGAVNFSLTSARAVWLWYDLTSQIWQVVA